MLAFTNDYLIGIESIDNEHRKLFELIEGIEELLISGGSNDRYTDLNSLIQDLNEYADLHFSDEEKYMESISDPELERQKKQHSEFRKKLKELSVIDISEGCNSVFTDMFEFLVKWLFKHILGSDMLIGKFKTIDNQEWKFTDKYFTGISFIDKEHKKLFEIIERAHKLSANEFIPDKYDNIMDIMQELFEYTQEHFSDEEAYMQKIGYDGLEAQKFAHEIFIEKLYNILDAKKKAESMQQEYLNDIMKFLYEWLVQHILKMDKKIPNKL